MIMVVFLVNYLPNKWQQKVKMHTAQMEHGSCVIRYCKVKVKEEMLSDLLPGPVTLVFERSETLNADLNPFTSVSPLLERKMKYQTIPSDLFSKCHSSAACLSL